MTPFCAFVLQLRPPTVIGQFHTLFFGSVRMFFLGVLGFAVYGNEALHFSCDPDRREVNLFCYNQFRPITPQVGPKYFNQTTMLTKRMKNYYSLKLLSEQQEVSLIVESVIKIIVQFVT